MDRVIGIVSISMLSRLLSPADFGLVAMSSAVAAITEVLTLFGFDWALLRVEQPTRSHYDTAWTLRLLAGIATWAALAAIAYPVSLFYRQPAVAPILVVMGANAAISAAENIGMVDFRRALRFDAEFKVRFVSRITSLVCAVALAWRFHTYWALVIGITASRVAAGLASYVMSPFRPHWSVARSAELLSFSAWQLLSAIINTLRGKFGEIYIGRVMGAHSVGVYAMADELSSVAATEIAAPINRVAFSKYTSEARSVPALRDRYFQISGIIWTVGLPAAVGIGLCATDIVALLLGPQWHDTALVLRVLAVAGVIGIMWANTHYVYLALGQARFVTMFNSVAAATFVMVTIGIAGSRGLLGVAIAQVVAAAITLALNYAALMRTLGITLLDIVNNQWRVMVASTVMGVLVWLLSQHFSPLQVGHLARLAILVSSGVFSYAIVLAFLWILGGRPRGAEEQLSRTAGEALRRIRARIS